MRRFPTPKYLVAQKKSPIFRQICPKNRPFCAAGIAPEIHYNRTCTQLAKTLPFHTAAGWDTIRERDHELPSAWATLVFFIEN
jgi:hypothetical protein